MGVSTALALNRSDRSGVLKARWQLPAAALEKVPADASEVACLGQHQGQLQREPSAGSLASTGPKLPAVRVAAGAVATYWLIWGIVVKNP